MLHNRTLSSNLVAAFVAAALGTAGAATLASQDHSPHESVAQHPRALVESTENPSAVHVRLSDQMDVESLNYDHPRRLRICNLTGRAAPASASANATGHTPIPLANQTVPLHPPSPVDLKVTYNGKSDQIVPGECYRFSAQHVRLTPAQPLAAGRALDLTVENVSGGGTQTASTPASVQHLNAELKQDDKDMRQATAELNRARAELTKTTHDLQHAKSQEEHVASLEHRTTKSERQQAQTSSTGTHGAPQADPEQPGTPE